MQNAVKQTRAALLDRGCQLSEEAVETLLNAFADCITMLGGKGTLDPGGDFGIFMEVTEAHDEYDNCYVGIVDYIDEEVN